jgi:hypothetical protein
VRRGPGPFGIGYDWFHQGESLLSFYVLTMAAPDRWRDRAQRFADLYVDPAHGNYDSRLRIVRAPVTDPAARGTACPTRRATHGCRERPSRTLPAGLVGCRR